MKKNAALILLILFTASLALSIYLFLDQKAKLKIISGNDKALLDRETMISAIKEKQTGIVDELTAAKKEASNFKSKLARLESENALLNVKATAVKSKLTALENEPNLAATKLQQELDDLMLKASETTAELATMEAKNSATETRLADQIALLQNSTNKIAEIEDKLMPFLELNKSANEIKIGLMKRPVTITKPVPPRPAIQAGKIKEPIPVQAPTPVTPPSEPPPTPAPAGPGAPTEPESPIPPKSPLPTE